MSISVLRKSPIATPWEEIVAWENLTVTAFVVERSMVAREYFFGG
jgi:hypothetical protein